MAGPDQGQKKVYLQGNLGQRGIYPGRGKGAGGKAFSPWLCQKTLSGSGSKRTKTPGICPGFLRRSLDFLSFHHRYATFAAKTGQSGHRSATPVGSGTVARTERIPVADRARSAVIAWMRHQTTNYDRMTIARVKGTRRQIRGRLASRSLELLQLYRQGHDTTPTCPLQRALLAD